jgi:enoyl-[acyl-carrier-protein] reductase (NADH)
MLKAANPSLKGEMTPDEVAQTILFLLSDESRAINGQNIHVYGV